MRYSSDCRNLPGYGDEITWSPFVSYPDDDIDEEDEDTSDSNDEEVDSDDETNETDEENL
ncbi:MAG: hypothetical protein WCP34_16120 [Pseudomonadota bacterium]